MPITNKYIHTRSSLIGFNTTGNFNFFLTNLIKLTFDLSNKYKIYFGVKILFLIKIFFEISLSIAIADGITPECV